MMNKFPREMKCPECDNTMKEYIHSYRCRNLGCRETIKKRFAPVFTLKEKQNKPVFIFHVIENNWQGTVTTTPFELKNDAIEFAVSKLFIPKQPDWEWKTGEGIFNKKFVVVGSSDNKAYYSIVVERVELRR